MEGIIVNTKRYKFKGGVSDKTLKKILWETYQDKDKISIHSLQLDHIIPYCISLDNSLSNLQLLKPREHREKSGKERKILNEFKRLEWIETITHYSLELKKPINFLIKEFKIRTKLQVLQVLQL